MSKIISISLDEDTLTQLDALALKEDRSRSNTIKLLLKYYKENNNKQSKEK